MSLKDLIKQINDLELEIKNIKLELDECKSKLPKLISGILQIKYLVGTVDGIKRHIYLFYDEHTTVGECKKDTNHVMVSDWLDQLFNKKDRKFIDFYLETHIFNPKINEAFKKIKAIYNPVTRPSDVPEGKYGQLVNLMKKVNRCIEGEVYRKYICPYKNIRIHYTDLRRYTYVEDLLKRLSKKHKYETNSEVMYYVLNEIYKKYKYYQDNPKEFYITNQIYKKFILDNIKGTKIEKQWKQIPDNNSKIDNIINLIYKNNEGKIIPLSDLIDAVIIWKFKLVDSHDPNIMNINTDTQEVFISKEVMHELLLPLGIPFMDLYLMGRLLKKFDVKDSNDPEYAEYSIIYAGAEHCSGYDEFLKSIGFKDIYKSNGISKEKYQCIDISGMPDIFEKE